MKEIGGYFGLELQGENDYFSEKIIRLNSGRNAFKYILRSQKIDKIYLPYYICNSVIEPLLECGTPFEFYRIDTNFYIIDKISLKTNEKLYYVNYFDLKKDYIDTIIKKYGIDAVIVDNSHAFFNQPINGVDTLYSPRKYFGVSDGGYLSTVNVLNHSFDIDYSAAFGVHLLGRIDKNASEYYNSYVHSENRLSNLSIKKMSDLTHALLKNIDYKSAKIKREQNFIYLHKTLKSINHLVIGENSISRFCYPLICEKAELLRDYLVRNCIYIPVYWNDVISRDDSKKTYKIEKEISKNLIPLPIDQRYGVNEMAIILNVIQRFMKEHK